MRGTVDGREGNAERIAGNVAREFVQTNVLAVHYYAHMCVCAGRDGARVHARMREVPSCIQ